MFDFQKGNIKFIRGGNYPHCHTIFVDDEIRVLIDAASNEDTLKKIHSQKPVQVIITSHGHEDHLMYNYLFPDAQLWVPKKDAHVFQDINALIEPYGPSAEEASLWEEFLKNECHYIAREPDRLLQDGDILKLGKTTIKVIHTPGHTPGHCAFHFLEESILYLGDLDLVTAGPYYGDPLSDLDETIRSLERIVSIKATTYLTAHGKGIFDGDPAHIKRYLATILKREEKLIEFLAQRPRTLDEIVQQGIIYGKSKNMGPWDLSLSEKSMMKKHLNRLETQKKICKKDGLYHLAK